MKKTNAAHLILVGCFLNALILYVSIRSVKPTTARKFVESVVISPEPLLTYEACSPALRTNKSECNNKKLTGSEKYTVCQVGTPSRHVVDFDECAWYKHTHRGALRLLKDKHILFVGDSRVRYQYISLAFFLVNGEWPTKDNGDLCYERLWMLQPDGRYIDNIYAWRKWYRDSNKAMGGYEKCDCFRSLNQGKSVENRYLYLPEHNIRVTFVAFMERNFFGRNIDVWGHDNFFPNLPFGHTPKNLDGIPCEPGYCNHTTCDWWYTLDDFVATVVAEQMDVTHLILGTGWRHAPYTSNKWKNAVDSCLVRGVKIIYIGNHAGRNWPRNNDHFTENATVRRLNMYDFSASLVKPEYMWDAKHFKTWVYSVFNHLTLSVLLE